MLSLLSGFLYASHLYVYHPRNLHVGDDVQGDSPATQVHDVTSAAQSLCSGDTIYTEVEKCIPHIQNLPEVMDIDGCRYVLVWLHIFVVT